MNFTERHGFIEKKLLQPTIDNNLRHSLWNTLEELFNKLYTLSKQYSNENDILKNMLRFFWCDFFKQPIYILEDHSPYLTKKIEMIRNKYYKMPWYEIYSFLEFTANFLSAYPKEKTLFIKSCNFVLDRENAAYRFIDDLIAPITSEIEISSIEVNLANEDEAAKHLNSALNMLANKQNDQSRESIAQSILAVEAIAKKITGDKNATLASLCHTAKILPSNPQARQALSNLYNYTSSKEGIRHDLTNESQPVTSAWARFMLVVSSAFVNLIKLEIESSKST